jgi:hexosaminidase
VLTEVMALFPSPYIHIGGDECPKKRWKVCTKCQAMMAKHKIKDEHHLQSYFITRMEAFINSKGRQIIGWDEILEGGLAPNAVVMSWRGMEGGRTAAMLDHPVVMSPKTHCYFDYSYNRISVERVYSFEPIPEGLPPEKHVYVLGAQGNAWTERMRNSANVEMKVFPRATALAEVVWSPKAIRDYDDFSKRLALFCKRLDVLNVNYNKGN